LTKEKHWNVKQLEEKVEELLNPPSKEEKKSVKPKEKQ
jgi:ParB family chromosome partitioning protein